MKYVVGRQGIAVVTGGASGIGLALAKALRDSGMTVVIADIDAERLDAAGHALGLPTCVVDVGNRASVEALRDQVIGRFGTVHLLCNNAGVGKYASFLDLSDEDRRWIMDINFWGTIYGIDAFLPVLRANAEGGHLINTISMMGFSGQVGASAYAASKFAALGATESLQAELVAADSNVRCVAFCPGPVESDIGDSERRRAARLGKPTQPQVSSASDDVKARLAYPRMNADVAAQIALRAYREGRFWAITHPELMKDYMQRHDAILASLDRTA
ncbi:SDR family NAD(P)-dependent oxidoreductase [Rhizorhapis suberifaciens]|uniref:NAD(P)-dependent dehydrogenase (Short-subunit alcohol dehydrogenase family) n=1 Tax=Rhizorhapis suberifaciens TaxID=13656 RepID=A0A840HVK3_9SPHN|nr:SDR family NAD(P)-dependent oxidoreductase [Rhizorhapis suberifaciens]MBB4641454.1 NAD(P)-dependent dehydrogenase (short-subunit alcohol dehydrogenase family) [Rhizorhapis suberifaciens]